MATSGEAPDAGAAAAAIGGAATYRAPAGRVRAGARRGGISIAILDRRQVTGIPKERHIPERSCIACGRKGPKGQLARIVRTPEGPVAPDPTGRANGRGAYLCDRVGCWERGLAKRALERSLRARVTDSDLKALQNYYIETIASGSDRRCNT